MSAGAKYSSSWGRPLYHVSALLCAVCLVGWLKHWFAPLWFAMAVGLRFGLVLLGNFASQTGVFGRVLLAGPTDKAQVALTFDDGPDPASTPRVLEVLERHGAKATFFVIGERAARHPALVRRIIEAGHQVENHSQRHSWATAFGPSPKLVREFSQAQAAIAKASGKTPRYFRAPIGILSPPIVTATRALGLSIVGWSAKARDGWASTTVGAACARLVAALRPGAILLLHDAAEVLSPHQASRGTIAPAVLEQLLPTLATRGLRAVTIDELLS